jgi:nicotinate-nucleotide pyrophosphorylase (carboxylating)
MARDYQQVEWDAAVEADCRRIIRAAVLEDLDRGYDWTTVALVPSETSGRAAIVARREGVIAGLPAAALVADEMDKALSFEPQIRDGGTVAAGDTMALIRGPARSLLAAERLVLNLLARLSGIATLTRRYVEAVAGTNARIYDTRKTTPGWRRLEKYAVRQGGGHNHRTGLFDAILIKDNHLAMMRSRTASNDNPGIASNRDSVDGLAAAAAAVRTARAFLAETFAGDERSAMIVEVEADSLAQVQAMLGERPDIVLLDNMTPDQLRAAVELRNQIAPAVELEASGGVSLETVRAIAETGIDRISVGAITHSAAALDIGLDWL